MITDLLFYEASGGLGEFYTTGGGSINLLRQHTDWRTNWTHIIPGKFGGKGLTDLLFYDASAGTGQFYTVDGIGGISLLHEYTNWRSSWTHIIPGQFGGNEFTDLLFYEAATGTAEFYTTNQGRISVLNKHTNWRTSWTRIVPALYAPLQAVRLHIKVLFTPPSSIASQVTDMREVFVSAGIRVVVASTEFLNLPQLLDVDVGSCKDGFGDNITGDVDALYKNRRGVGSNDLVIYYVRSTNPPFGGCAKYPGDKAGAIVTSNIIKYTLGHEVGHVLGLNHTDSNKRLMFAGQTIDNPPDLNDREKVKMFMSKYTINL